MKPTSALDKLVQQQVESAQIEYILGRSVTTPTFSGIGDVHAKQSDELLSYIKSEKFISDLNDNKCIGGVFCKREHFDLISERIFKIVCEDPNFCFFSLVDLRASFLFDDYPSQIQSDYDPLRVEISKVGVRIGKGCLIEPNVVIHKGVDIGDNGIIRSGAILGLDTFQHQRHLGGILSPRHDGILQIGDNVEIGANTCVSRGFSYRSTIIGSNTKVDALCYIAHGVQVGDSSIICAGAKLMGHVAVGEGVFIGPSAIVSSRSKVGDRAKVSIGSVVTKDVASGDRVSGNFAVDHQNWINFVKSISA